MIRNIEGQYPKYQIFCGTSEPKDVWATDEQAAGLYASPTIHTELGALALEADGREREMSPEEKRLIIDRAADLLDQI